MIRLNKAAFAGGRPCHLRSLQAQHLEQVAVVAAGAAPLLIVVRHKWVRGVFARDPLTPAHNCHWASGTVKRRRIAMLVVALTLDQRCDVARRRVRRWLRRARERGYRKGGRVDHCV